MCGLVVDDGNPENYEPGMPSLPKTVIIDDVVYEYGSRYYRVKRFEPNETGKYRIHNDYLPGHVVNGLLRYCNPYSKLSTERTDLVRSIQFDKYPCKYENFNFPKLEFAEVISKREPKSLFYKGCLYKTDIDNASLCLCYVSDDNMRTIEIPRGYGVLDPFSVNDVRLHSLEKLIIPSDVRSIRTIGIKSNVVFEVHNDEIGIKFKNNEGNRIIYIDSNMDLG